MDMIALLLTSFSEEFKILIPLSHQTYYFSMTFSECYMDK